MILGWHAPDPFDWKSTLPVYVNGGKGCFSGGRTDNTKGVFAEFPYWDTSFVCLLLVCAEGLESGSRNYFYQCQKGGNGGKEEPWAILHTCQTGKRETIIYFHFSIPVTFINSLKRCLEEDGGGGGMFVTRRPSLRSRKGIVSLLE